MTILEWAKANAKEDANFAELEELVERANPINGIKSKEQAEVFINDNAAFKSYFDSYVSRAVDNHDTKFKETKLPDILKEEREKIRQELNPKETEEQKAIRELREANQRLEGDIQRKELMGELRVKAKEYSLPDNIADQFVVYGENAMNNLTELGEYFDTAIKAGVENEVKARFKGQGAPESSAKDNAKIMARADFDALDASSKATFMREGGKLE